MTAAAGTVFGLSPVLPLTSLMWNNVSKNQTLLILSEHKHGGFISKPAEVHRVRLVMCK